MVTQWIALLLFPICAYSSPVDPPVPPSHGGVRYLSGSNGYGYIGEDQYKIEMRKSDGSVEGVYGYKMPNGRTHTTSYVSDERGYRLQANDVLETFLGQGGLLHQITQGTSVPLKTRLEAQILSNDQLERANAICSRNFGKDYEAYCSAKNVYIYGIRLECPFDGMCERLSCVRIQASGPLTFKRVTPGVGASCVTKKTLSDDEVEPANSICRQLAGNGFEAYCSPENVNRYGKSSRNNYCQSDDMCKRLGCFKKTVQDTVHTFQQVTPREGASCGTGKVCKEGKCVKPYSQQRRQDHAVALPDATAISLRKGVSQSRIQATAIADKEAYASPVASSYSGKEGMSLSAPSGVAIVGPGGIAIADTYSLSYSSMSDADIEKLRGETAKKRKQMKTNPNPQPLYYKDFIGYKERF